MTIAKSYKKFSVIFFNCVIILAVISVGIFPYSQSVQAASYTFTQTNWSGGVTANNSTHPTDQSNWTEYSSSSAEIVTVNGGASLEISSSTASSTQTTDTQFNNGTFSNAITTGSGSSASVKLSKALHINEYTIGASTTIASVTASSVAVNSNGTWTVAFSNSPNLARLFKNDKFITDEIHRQTGHRARNRAHRRPQRFRQSSRPESEHDGKNRYVNDKSYHSDDHKFGVFGTDLFGLFLLKSPEFVPKIAADAGYQKRNRLENCPDGDGDGEKSKKRPRVGTVEKIDKQTEDTQINEEVGRADDAEFADLIKRWDFGV